MQLKIASYWHPFCHHYSFHRPYQQCGAHSVGGQSSCFHGAFVASPSTPASPYSTHALFSVPVLRLPFHDVSILSPFLFFPPSPSLLGSTDERHPPQCGETRDKGEEEGTSQRRTFTHTGEVMTSTMSYDRWGKATRENRKRWWNDRNKHGLKN